jgi:NAD(P)-dependent dehydrogenase (short-subunit alcohol dehydrogenase family)
MSERGAVVVTGASTGIGEATAQRLATEGFRVFGAVRREEDAERLRGAGTGLEPVLLDVTDADAIARAAAQVRNAAGPGLEGLVNNAGVAVSGPLEYLPVDELRTQLEVNLVAQVAVTQAFLPALRAARGRIVNISSIGGRIALPLAGPYAASKFGLEAVSDSLRRELASSGVQVAVVEPGGVRTPIWDKGTEAADRALERMPAEAAERYGDLARAIRAEVQRISREGLAPEAVADVVVHALTARRPRTRYLVGRDAKMRARAAKVLPDRVMDRLIARALSH